MSLMPIISPSRSPLAIAFFDSSASLDETITAPAAIIAGDMLFLLDHAVGLFSTPGEVIPAGFTTISSIVGLFTRQIISYKIADGSEGGSTITGMSTLTNKSKVLLVFRPTSPVSMVTISGVSEEVTDNAPAPQNIPSASGNAPLIAFGCWGSINVPIDPRTMTPAKDDERSSGTDLYIGWKIYNSNPENVSVEMEDEGAGNLLQSFYAQLA